MAQSMESQQHHRGAHSSRKLVERRLASTNYRILKVLGEGTYGQVYLARDAVTKQFVAIKVIEKRRISLDDMVRVRREIQVLSVMRQPNIIQIFRVHEDDSSLYLVMEYADGGELYDFVEKRKKLNSNEARAVFRQIVAAVHYCHKNGIVHRDLKLENILLNSRYQVKLTDFGLCNYYNYASRLSTFCGSPLYASPEIIAGQPYVGPEIDCWSLGVLLYALVYGSMPFGHAEFAKLRSQILSGQFFAPPDGGDFSDAHELICQCLCVSAQQRATIDQISCHWWTNVNYLHYPHCEIYGDGNNNNQPASSCSCFFDILSHQISKPPEGFRGKLAHHHHHHHNHRHGKDRTVVVSPERFKGVHAHHHHHHQKQSSNHQQPPVNMTLAFPTPATPQQFTSTATLQVGDTALKTATNEESQLYRPVSLDSLNGGGGGGGTQAISDSCLVQPQQPQPQQPSKLGRVSSLPAVANRHFSPQQQQRRRSLSEGAKSRLDVLDFTNSSGHHPYTNGNNHRILSALLDPSLEHLECCGQQQETTEHVLVEPTAHQVLHRNLSNYDNYASNGYHFDDDDGFDASRDVPLPFDEKQKERRQNNNSNNDDVYHSTFSLSSSSPSSASASSSTATLSTSSSGSVDVAAAAAASASSFQRQNKRQVEEDEHQSSSCCSSSPSSSCSSVCSSQYDGFVGSAALQQLSLNNHHQQQQQHNETAVIPPLELSSTPASASNSLASSFDSSSCGAKEVAPPSSADRRQRVAAFGGGRMAVQQQQQQHQQEDGGSSQSLDDNTIPNYVKKDFQVDLLSSSFPASSPMRLAVAAAIDSNNGEKLRVYDDDELLAMARQQLDTEDQQQMVVVEDA